MTKGSRALSTSPVLASTATGHPYSVPRNSRGSLPVYTDIRNAGTRHQTLIRNIDGDPNALVKDLTKALFSDLAHVRVQVTHHRHIVISGGRFKHKIVDWLKAKGF
ncbi:hypothetical protein BDN71DRAFT_1380820 [Pleurotus eryngii]|uniref:Large ribosomal subunit protein mL49 n=1 Tax=Pleurotus eryngii TaxID=5323 RepID=A0A9P6ABN9_PLEER|nr:hypothetical protein BDN71DRAFT_1380820 [Pleurotus eryngii]